MGDRRPEKPETTCLLLPSVVSMPSALKSSKRPHALSAALGAVYLARRVQPQRGRTSRPNGEPSALC